MGLKCKVFEMQKWNISAYKAQKVNEKKNVIRLVMSSSKVMVIRISKMAHLMYFLLNTEKNRPSLGKIFKCIWKVLFGPFTKYYELWSSVLPFADFQNLKIQDFTSPLLTQYFLKFFVYLFILIFLHKISHEQLRPRPIKHTIFCKNSMRSSTCT